MSEITANICVEELPEGYAGIVPILVDLSGDELTLEVYEGLEGAAEEYLEKFENCLFSNKALDFLCRKTDEYLQGKLYRRDEYGRTRFYNKFMLTDGDMVKKEVILPTSVKMAEEYDSLENLTSLFAEDTGKIPPMSYVTVDEGKIVSVATVNDTESDSVLEITVNTAPEYRGRGYGASNTAALALYLIEKGYAVAYCVSAYNKASIKIAKKCGFEKTGRFYAVSAYKIN